jgi:hypothetical protein
VPKPQRPRMPCRNFSRSSGVMWFHRSAMRPRNLERCIPRPLIPPKRIRHSARIPTACQKVFRGGALQLFRPMLKDKSELYFRVKVADPPIKTMGDARHYLEEVVKKMSSPLKRRIPTCRYYKLSISRAPYR